MKRIAGLPKSPGYYWVSWGSECELMFVREDLKVSGIDQDAFVSMTDWLAGDPQRCCHVEIKHPDDFAFEVEVEGRPLKELFMALGNRTIKGAVQRTADRIEIELEPE